MAVLLEFKEQVRGIYSKYESYLLPVFKFILAIGIFLLIREKLGYMQRLNSVPFLVILALAASILPMSVMLLITGALVTLHCYALSLPVGVTALLLFVIMYLLYFRFAPQMAYNALLTPLAFGLGIPYVMPVVNGLLQSPTSVIPTVCGTVMYFFLKGVIANEANLATVDEGEQITDKFAEIINQLVGNREMYLTALVFAAVALAVFIIRRLSVDYAWTIAIVTGILLEYFALFMGYMDIGIYDRMAPLTVGCVVSALIAFVFQFFFFNLDYTRAERVQFEDDEYYYYVKAIPKRYVSGREKTIKKISSNGRPRRDGVTREELMEDMDIHMNDD